MGVDVGWEGCIAEVSLTVEGFKAGCRIRKLRGLMSMLGILGARFLEKAPSASHFRWGMSLFAAAVIWRYCFC